MDEIDRSLLTDEVVRVSPRLAAHVMAEVRALAQPAPPRFPWREFSLKLASYGGLAAMAASVFMSVDPTVFRPVAPELFSAGAMLVATFVTMRLLRLRAEFGD